MARRSTTPIREIEVTLSGEGPAAACLTPSDRRLLALLTTSLSLREIAALLGISRASVMRQAVRVYRKLGVYTPSETIERRSELQLVAGRR
jgi:DNA-binding NarL/FixJ family response regulator